LSHHENENQNFIEIPFHSSQNGYNQEKKKLEREARCQMSDTIWHSSSQAHLTE
jgi:hypothetical protein